jgi:hypothetical protein
MIQAKELRIGNWVKCELTGALLTITRIEHGFIQSSNKNGFNTNGIEPIPLTPEILEKAGFSYLLNNGGQLYYIIYDSGFTVMQSYGKWHFSPSKSTTLGNEIKYLHQLQNLYFALTGQELTIDLNH